MRGGPTFDEEKYSINTAWLKKGGERFEIVVDPDLAVSYKEGVEISLRELLKAEKIFVDAKKGELASEIRMTALFGTSEPLIIAEKILQEGEIQLTAEHREKVRQAKKNKIITFIHMNAINPQTGVVHPTERISRAMDEAKVRVDEFKTADEQVKEIIKQLQPIIPLKITMFIADVHIPSTHAAKTYGTLTSYGTIIKEEWLNDGSLAASVELPAGRYHDLVDELNSRTHGSVDVNKRTK